MRWPFPDKPGDHVSSTRLILIALIVLTVCAAIVSALDG